jgi:prefoldin subunit 5
MSQSERALRLTSRVVHAPYYLEDVHRIITVAHEIASSNQAQLQELRSELRELTATFEAVSKAHLEALAFLTRSINEVGARLEQLERAGNTPEP